MASRNSTYTPGVANEPSLDNLLSNGKEQRSQAITESVVYHEHDDPL